LKISPIQNNLGFRLRIFPQHITNALNSTIDAILADHVQPIPLYFIHVQFPIQKFHMLLSHLFLIHRVRNKFKTTKIHHLLLPFQFLSHFPKSLVHARLHSRNHQILDLIIFLHISRPPDLVAYHVPPIAPQSRALSLIRDVSFEPKRGSSVAVRAQQTKISSLFVPIPCPYHV
jgi:hypothetical protein